MASSLQPRTRLRILTIDGGGLQGITTLIVLDKLLKTISQESEDPEKVLRPCDVFDVISGTGTGGWLALFLGRFQMSVSTAMAEWHSLIDCIRPEPGWISCLFSLYDLYDTDRLVEEVDRLTDRYKTGKYMSLPPSERARCRHVFVSALRTDLEESHLPYTLFRTYDRPQAPVASHKYLISHAFAATGATRYLTPPRKDPSLGEGKAIFQDVQFPFPHNITGIALDEIEQLYGPGTNISIIINIGPGIPKNSDCQRRMGRTESESQAKKRSSDSNNALSDQPNDEIQVSEAKAILEADVLRTSIRKKLQDTYTLPNRPKYYHFAPIESIPRSALNDTLCSTQCESAAKEYLKMLWLQAEMREVATCVANEPLYSADRVLEVWQMK